MIQESLFNSFYLEVKNETDKEVNKNGPKSKPVT